MDKRALEALSKNYMLVCVTSRATLAEVIQELRFLNVKRFFSHAVTRGLAARHFGLTSLPFLPFQEQSRKLYQCALEMAKSSPEKTVAVGDMGSELMSAKDLRMTTIGLVAHKARKKNRKRHQIF